MKLNPQARKVIELAAKVEAEGGPSPEELGVAGLREFFKTSRGKLTPNSPEVGHLEDLVFQGPGGKIAARYYRPIGSDMGQAFLS